MYLAFKFEFAWIIASEKQAVKKPNNAAEPTHE